MTVQRLFLHHDGPRGDVLFCRPLLRAAAASGRFDLVVGACRDDVEILADLAGPRCTIAASAFANTPHGAVASLEHLCPEGVPRIAIWLGGNEDWPTYQWADVVDAFHRDLRRLRIDAELDVDPDVVPMLDFATEVVLPPLRRTSIFLDLDRAAAEPCHFVFDLARLAEALPDVDFLCTAAPRIARDNLVDVSGLGPVGRSKLSERCAAAVGRTMDSFGLVLTEANRWQPKALCGWDARVTAPRWDYPGNPLELLGTMDELVDFLLANVAEECAR